jgi:cell fate regulator YaaT (PSP1 superfamily)
VSHLVEVAFGGNRKEFFLWESAEVPPVQAPVIVEADRGEDYGRVHATGELAEKRSLGCAHGCGTSRPARKGLRIATAAEIKQAEALPKMNDEARRHAMQRVRAQGLGMKVSDAEWQWDRKKLALYFTAEHRVDFRQLVRELAAQFRTRIELKQIGVRDEAKRLDGVGRCGRQYCSASWLPELRPVNLGVAKDQRLSLNPSQISGACGRLMCCLRYEHEVYVAARKRFPKEGRLFQTARGEERVLAVDIFNERVTLRSGEGETRVLSLAGFREETGAPAEPPALSAAVVAEPPVAEDERQDAVAEEESPVGTIEDAVTDVADDSQEEPRPERGSRRRRGRRGGRGGRRTRDRQSGSDGSDGGEGSDGSGSGGSDGPPEPTEG